MTHGKISSLLLFGAMIGAAAAAYAQQAETAAPTSAAAPPAASAAQAPAEAKNPSADTMKKAKQAGYRAKLRKGQTLFCKEEAELGTHFTNENCIDENQLLLVLEREQAQRDQMASHSCGGNGACGGK
jgi:hypothetical protein